MKVVIAGSRHITDYDLLLRAVEEFPHDINLVIQGGSKGVDAMGDRWAKENAVQVCTYPPLWDAFGKGAGPIRNCWMAKEGDALILIWDGVSRGSWSIRSEFIKRQKLVLEMVVKGELGIVTTCQFHYGT
jgi:hypothetical protein